MSMATDVFFSQNHIDYLNPSAQHPLSVAEKGKRNKKTNLSTNVTLHPLVQLLVCIH